MTKKLLCCVSSFCFSFESGFSGCLFSGELLSFLLSYSLAFHAVFLNLGLKTSLSLIGCFSSILSLSSLSLFVAACFPGIETTLCLLFVESAFLNATAEVLHKENALFGEDRTNCVGGLSTNFHPIQGTVEV